MQDVFDGDRIWYKTAHLSNFQAYVTGLNSVNRCCLITQEWQISSVSSVFHPSLFGRGSQLPHERWVSLLVVEYCVSRGIRKEKHYVSIFFKLQNITDGLNTSITSFSIRIEGIL